jgi:hypothetical protein
MNETQSSVEQNADSERTESTKKKIQFVDLGSVRDETKGTAGGYGDLPTGSGNDSPKAFW